ncbi:MAG: sec-independent protein translocase protein TatC [Thermoleophilaceae bacterium]|jgi:sec-independent protein translocase protein TatC|nr:sec-independent protein translocase protein TatC [Thermoleophilaceae bacterium]
MAKLKSVSHDDRLTVVEHLDELRTRIVVSLASFGVALALCFWQNHQLLHWLNKPLHGKQPITFGVAEAFTTTLTVTAYAALVLSLPVLLYQLYAYVLPAFTPNEARVARPLLLMVPLLFVAGAAFGYFLVVPAATKFLLHFNADEFNTQIRARDYYYFVTTTMLACGAVFQMPVLILAATRLGITSAEKLRRNRRYAILICVIVAAALPGVDPVSMMLEALPLIVLFELSILLAKAFGRPSGEVSERWASAEGS